MIETEEKIKEETAENPVVRTDVKRKKEKKPRNIFKALAVIELVAMAALSVLTVKLLNDNTNGNTNTIIKTIGKAEPTTEAEERVNAIIEKEETLYQLDGKKILMNDGTYGEIFFPVFADVPACTRSEDSIVTRNGYSFYKENGNISSIAGVDVSEHQGDIDWKKVKNAGYDFAIIRIGYRTYGGGEIKLDSAYEKNLEKASAAGLKIGAYFYSQAVNTKEAIEEADAVIDALKPYDITYPVIFDWELIYGDSARTDKMTVEGLADCCTAFCERVKGAGYKPMIYQNKNTTMFKMDLPRLKDYDFWLAEYGEKPSYYYDYQIWQYSSKGKVPGIPTEVDLNISFVDYGKDEND